MRDGLEREVRGWDQMWGEWGGEVRRFGEKMVTKGRDITETSWRPIVG